MTARPLDYGDRYPSDIGDVPPGSPVDGFEERDYRIRRRTIAGIQARPDVKASPNLGVEREYIKERESFLGVLVKRVQANRWVVLRQDGKRVFADTRGDDGVYDSLSIGETVSLHAGQVPGSWLIEGSERRKEMASIRLTNSASVNVTSAAKQITFVQTIEETGEDVFEKVAGGGVRVLKDFSAQYEISLTVHVRLDPAYIDEATLSVATTCETVPGFALSPGQTLPTTRLKFRRQNGFVIRYDAEDCSVHVGLQAPIWSMLAYGGNPDGQSWAVWTDSPVIGGRLRVLGLYTGQGWLELGPGGVSAYQSRLGLGNGRGQLRIVFPDAPASWSLTEGIPMHSYMYVAGKRPLDQAVKLQFSQGGGTGVIYTPSGDYVVDKGLVISGPGITPAPFTNGQTFDVNVPAEVEYDCEDFTTPFG